MNTFGPPLDPPSYDEIELSRECGRENVDVSILTTEAKEEIVALRRMLEDENISGALSRHDILRRDITIVSLPVCPFDGDVTATVHGYTIVWDCPVCGHHHEEEVDR